MLLVAITKCQHNTATLPMSTIASNKAASHRSRLICRFAQNSTNFLFKDCEHAKPRFDHSTNFLFKLVNTRFAHETLKLFIQTSEHAKPR